MPHVERASTRLATRRDASFLLRMAAATGEGSATLLQTLVEALRSTQFALASGGSVRIDTLFSRPRKVNTLYPLAHVHPTDAGASSEADAVPVWLEHVVVTAAWAEASTDAERLMYALELFVYTLPTQGAGILYVSKLDTTGHGPRAVPGAWREHLPEEYRGGASLTTVITAATLAYFMGRDHWRQTPGIRHVSLHILARAQGAYLFPSSTENAGKRVLSDTALIRWWRACVSEAIWRRRLAGSTDMVHAYYVLPGYTRLDSHPLVPLPPADTPAASATSTPRDKLAGVAWRYGHPYSRQGAALGAEEPLPPLPLHPAAAEERSRRGRCAFPDRVLATVLPVFPDDPKGRFINEITREAHEPGTLVSAGTSGPARPTAAHRAAMHERQVLDRTSVDEFWERMGFRQECSSGNTVGVFVVGFSEPAQASDTAADAADAADPPAAQPLSLPHPLPEDLVFKQLMRDACDWSSRDGSTRLTREFYQAVDHAVRRKGDVGPGAAADEQLGRDVRWARVALRVPSREAQEAASRAAQKVSAEGGPGAARARPADAPPVQMLQVKRKRKA